MDNKSHTIPAHLKPCINPGDPVLIFVKHHTEPIRGKFISKTDKLVCWENANGSLQAKETSEVIKIERDNLQG